MADENNMNNENDPKSILMLPGLLAVVVVLVAGFLIFSKIIPQLSEFATANSEYTDAVKALSQKEQQLETYKASNAQQLTSASVEAEKEFYKPLESGVDSESVIAAEFNEILALMTSNSIKTRSVKYTYDPQDDNFVRGAADKYSVCKLDMSMIANYNNFKNFMKDLYKHDHYLDIAKVEIVPYQKNKTILLIELQLKLYAEKV